VGELVRRRPVDLRLEEVRDGLRAAYATLVADVE
jgi:hypothetical protein